MCKYKKDQKEKCACLEKQKLHMRKSTIVDFLIFACICWIDLFQ